MYRRDVTRRGVLAAAGTGAAGSGALLLAGCGLTAGRSGSAGGQGAPAGRLAAEKRVEFWGATGGAFADDLTRYLQTVRAQTNLFVDYVLVPGGWVGMTQKMDTGVASGAVPDLAGIKDFSMKQYAVRDSVLRLDKYFGATGSGLDSRRFRRSEWEAMQLKGVPYAAPWPGSFVHVLFVNRDLFTRAGLDPDRPPARWDELADVSRRLTDTGAEQWGHAFYELGTREYNLMMFSIYAGQAGGRIFSDDLSRVTLDTPAGNEAMDWMHAMLWRWGAAVPPDKMGNLTTMIQGGKVATWNAGPWSIWDHRQKAPQLNWSIAQWPCHKSCDNVDAPECLLILRGAPDPDTSWLAMRSLLSPELDLQLAGPRGALPVYEENLDRGIFATDPAFKAYAKIGRGKDLRPRAFLDGYEDIAAAITPELQAVWLNQKSPKDGLAAAERAGNAALARLRGK
jgi:ABC-type glycerol-3-phosphate transport system substrate-binding protein